MLSSQSARFAALLTFAWLCLSLVFPAAPGGGVSWEGDFEAAMVRAKTESKVVFLAVNMDDEKGNDRMVQNVYTDRTILKLTEGTVNLVASVGRHKSDGACPHLGTITCEQHRAVEGQVNGKILKPNSEGEVVAPQHVWLNGEGQVLLSVPYEVSAGELEWCFHEAGRRNDPNYSAKESADSKPPVRWIPAGVYDAEKDPAERPPTREEALELIKEIRKGVTKGADLVKSYRRLAQADEPEAREQVLQFLKSGGGGGKRGGGGAEWKIALVRIVGATSPQSYWEVLDTLVGSGEEELRNEVTVAMEQLAAPAALKSLNKAFKKEKDEGARKNLLRAIAACGGQDKATRSLLIKSAKQTRDGVLRRNALIGMGWQNEQAEVREVVEKVLVDGTLEDRIAAVVGMGISRDPLWLDTLEKLAEAEEAPTPEGDPEAADLLSLPAVARAALEVHAKGDYRALGAALLQASGDTIPRNRLFRPLKAKGKKKDGEEGGEEEK